MMSGKFLGTDPSVTEQNFAQSAGHSLVVILWSVHGHCLGKSGLALERRTH